MLRAQVTANVVILAVLELVGGAWLDAVSTLPLSDSSDPCPHPLPF